MTQVLMLLETCSKCEVNPLLRSYADGSVRINCHKCALASVGVSKLDAVRQWNKSIAIVNEFKENSGP